MKELRPIINKKKYTDTISKVIEEFLWDYYYSDIWEVIKPIEGYYNDQSNDVIIEALRKNQIQYVDGKFYGKFNAEISKALIKLGAKWNARTKTFDIARNKLGMELLGAIANVMMFAEVLHKSLIVILDRFSTENIIENVLPDLKKLLDIPLDYVLEDLEEQATNNFFYRPNKKKPSQTATSGTDTGTGTDTGASDKGGAGNTDKGKDTGTGDSKKDLEESISVHPRLNKEEAQALKDELTENVSLSIKNFTDAETIKLRQLVQKNALEGLKEGSLVDVIRKQFNVTLNKAKFLARNETELFTAKFQEIRLRKLGITKYKWSATGFEGHKDARTREAHWQMSERSRKGEIFDYKNPPLLGSNKKMCNPGEDYNCRCRAIPVIE